MKLSLSPNPDFEAAVLLKGTSLFCVSTKTWACLWRQGPLVTFYPHKQSFSVQMVLDSQWFDLQFFDHFGAKAIGIQ